jgi:hypothetical protein
VVSDHDVCISNFISFRNMLGAVNDTHLVDKNKIDTSLVEKNP